jgi:hypothetical protein
VIFVRILIEIIIILKIDKMTIGNLIKQLSVYPKNTKIKLIIEGESELYGICGLISPIDSKNVNSSEDVKNAFKNSVDIKILISKNSEIL